MVNFADCVSKVQCRNLVTNTPTKNGIKTVLEKTVSNSKRLDSISEAINVAVQNRAMYSMGAKEKRMNWVQKFIKNIAMNLAYSKSAYANTTTFTNIGNIQVADPYKPYIEMFHAFLPMSKGQNLKGTICSFGDTLVMNFSYIIKDTSIQRCFFRKIAEDGIHVEIESNGVTYE